MANPAILEQAAQRMKYATCHSDREHVAHGLCDCCYRSTVYYADREAHQKRIAAYYAKNAAELRAKRKARYGKKILSGGVENALTPTNRLITGVDGGSEKRERCTKPTSGSSAPPAQNLSYKSWWREEAKPRRWIIEAQQEAAA